MEDSKRINLLGDTSCLYSSRGDPSGIFLDKDNCVLEFYTAGHTKFSTRDKVYRNATICKLYEHAVALNTERNLYPFKDVRHCVRLVLETKNPKDPYAMQIILQATSTTSRLHNLHGFDLGYVPAKISRQLSKYYSYINCGQILKLKADFHKGLYRVKIALGYGNKYRGLKESDSLNRFLDILEEG